MIKSKQVIKMIIAPVNQRFMAVDLMLFIPRFVCGFLLAARFGADKFGMPWSPADRNLGLFEVIYRFPQEVAEYGGIFALFPIFFAWMGAFSEAVGAIFF